MSDGQGDKLSGVKWNEVTWYSRLGAIIFFVGVIPVLFFYIGTQYELVMSSEQQLVSNIQMDTTANMLNTGESYATSTDNPDFRTFADTNLGFSIDIPEVAYSGVSGCAYVANNDSDTDPSYEEVTSPTTTAPLEVQIIGNSAYVDYAYDYDLVQKANGSRDYSNCRKRSMAEYLPIYLTNPNDSNGLDPFLLNSDPTPPISITFEPATSTAAAESIALQEGKTLFDEPDCPYSLVAKPSMQTGVFDLTAQLPSSFTLHSDESQCNWPMIVKYSPQNQKVVVIENGTYQSCAFPTHDFNSYDTSAVYDPANCYDTTIDNSFKFIPVRTPLPQTAK